MGRKSRPEGLSIGWFANGQKRSEVNYKNGNKEGLNIIWDENGQKRQEVNYKNDKLEWYKKY